MLNTSFTKPINRIKFAIFVNILASACYAIMLSIAKSSLTTCSMNQLTFFKSCIALFLILICVTYKKKENTYLVYLKSTQMKTHIIRSLSSLIMTYIFLFSIKTISIAETNLLFNTSPVFIPLVAYAWKRIPVDHRIWPGIILSFIGIAFLIHPGSTSYAPGFWLGLGGGFVGAISVMALRFSHYSEPLCRSLFYFAFFSSLITGILCLIEGQSLQFLSDPNITLALLSIGVSGFLCQLFFAISLKYAPAKLITPFCYISVIFSLILDLIFWKKPLHILEILGMLLVLTGLYLMVFLLQKKKTASLNDSVSMNE